MNCALYRLILSISLIAMFPLTAHARTWTLLPDGSGDVPTFQAGMDSLLTRGFNGPVDTLLVMSGNYDESVFLGLLESRFGDSPS